jgi:hypothetical protein
MMRAKEKKRERGGGSSPRGAQEDGARWPAVVRGATDAATGWERTGERGGVRGPHVQNVGQTGKKGNGPGPRENSVGFLIN